MSSIRPLATVTVLIGVGVVLWMKINQTEPVLPDEIGDWPIGAELEVGDGAPGAAVGDTAAPPNYSPGEAPAYEPGDAPAYDAPAYEAPATGDEAPAWDAEATTADEQAVTTPRDASDLPPMPGIPPLDEVLSEQRAQDAALSQTADATSSPAPSQGVETAPEGAGVTPTPQTSVYAAARVRVQGALDRGELASALLVLSDWYDDTSLSAEQEQEVKTLLSQLAGSVIYSREPRLEAPYLVQSGETLDDIAAQYQVPAALLAKINGVTRSTSLEAGTQLKVIKGPFSAVVDFSERELRLMLDRRYAGRFDIEIEPDCSVEAGQWVVNQKPLSPTGGYGDADGVARSLVLANPAAGGGQIAVVRGAGSAGDIAAEPRHRMIRLKSGEIDDVFDILSVGSRVTIRR